MSEPFDPSRSLTAFEQDSTVIAVIEMSQSNWLVAAVIPGVERQPLKKLDPDEEALLKLLHHWRSEANRAGCQCRLNFPQKRRSKFPQVRAWVVSPRVSRISVSGRTAAAAGRGSG